MKYWLVIKRKRRWWLIWPEGSMSGTQSLFCHRWRKNGDSWMESWMSCWKSPGWEGELLRTPVSPDWHWNAADALAGPSASWPLWVFTRCEYSPIIFSVRIGQSPFTHIATVCVWGISVCHWMTHGEKLSFFCSACLFLSEWFILNKFLAQCLFLQPQKSMLVFTAYFQLVVTPPEDSFCPLLSLFVPTLWEATT